MKPAIAVFLLSLIACASLLAQTNPLPMVNNPLVPSSAAPGSGGFTLTINGSGFVANSRVNWNGSPRPTSFISSTQLTAVISTTDLVAFATAQVTVSNPAPGGGTSNAVAFTVNTPVSGSAYVPTRFDFDGFGPSLSLDVNRDGHLDVVRVCCGQLYVRLGAGDGTFGPSLRSNIESGTTGATAADFNRDGKPDLAVTNTNGTVSILLGNGDGSFQTHFDYPTGINPNGIATGDLNGDGATDIVVANNSPAGGISVLLGLGNGLFQNQVAYAAGPSPYVVTLADFNRDGRLDVAVADTGSATVLFGNGDGTLQKAKGYSLANFGDGLNYSILAADFDADGILDLAIGENNRAFILRGTSNGVFVAPLPVVINKGAVKSMIAADFNEDGKLDLAATSGGSEFYLSMGNGDGTFEPLQVIRHALSAFWLSAGDFNEDGSMDVGLGSGVSLQTTATISATSLRFPNTFVGQQSPSQDVLVHNYAMQPLNITSIAITSGSSDYDQTNDCGTSLAGYSSCTVRVTFSPSAEGTRSGFLTISFDAVGATRSVSLTGKAVQPVAPIVTLSPTSLTFSDQKVGTTSAAQNVTLTNTGLANLNIASIVAGGDFAQVNTCPPTLHVGQNCTLIVTFTPTATGVRSGAITITDNAFDSPQTVPLSGTGTP